MKHWTEEEAEKRGLLPICGRALSWATDGNSKYCEECLREALLGENLKRSMLFFEKERILRELREAAAATGSDRAVQTLESVIKRIEES